MQAAAVVVVVVLTNDVPVCISVRRRREALNGKNKREEEITREKKTVQTCNAIDSVYSKVRVRRRI